jgi:hypothetical protein
VLCESPNDVVEPALNIVMLEARTNGGVGPDRPVFDLLDYVRIFVDFGARNCRVKNEPLPLVLFKDLPFRRMPR